MNQVSAGTRQNGETQAETGGVTVPRCCRWLLLASGLVALAGYFGPWVPSPAAGLVVTGLDLGEYVKFLPPVQSGEIALWRQAFYLPLVAVSVAFSLQAYRRELGYPWPVRLILLAVAAVAALNQLPPAWTPGRLVSPEFRLQTISLVVCLGMVLTSPLLALLPRFLAGLVVLLLVIPAIWLPVQAFLTILPAISQLYNHPLAPGWGMGTMVAGLAGMAIAAALVARPEWTGRHG
jgi:hypothetical protein